MRYSVFYHHICCAAEEQGCSLDEMLEQVRLYGIEYVELDRDDVGAGDNGGRKLFQRLKAHDLKPSSIYGFYDLGNPNRRVTRDDLLLHQAQYMSCDKIMVIPGFYSALRNAECCDGERAQMLEECQKLTEYAGELGITVTIEDFDDEKSPISTISGMKQFLDYIPKLQVTLDTGNFIFQGEDVEEAQQTFSGRISHVHLKDRYLPMLQAGILPETMRLAECKEAVNGTRLYACAVGAGHIPIRSVVGKLEASGYDGILTIEHFGVPSYADAIRDSVNWLKGNVEYQIGL